MPEAVTVSRKPGRYGIGVCVNRDLDNRASVVIGPRGGDGIIPYKTCDAHIRLEPEELDELIQDIRRVRVQLEAAAAK